MGVCLENVQYRVFYTTTTEYYSRRYNTLFNATMFKCIALYYIFIYISAKCMKSPIIFRQPVSLLAQVHFLRYQGYIVEVKGLACREPHSRVLTCSDS